MKAVVQKDAHLVDEDADGSDAGRASQERFVGREDG